MADVWVDTPDKTTSDTYNNADYNQHSQNIRLLGGNGTSQPSSDIETLAGLVSQNTPAGVIYPYAGLTAPTGFLLCDGSAVSRTTYATLWAAISVSKGTCTISIASPGVVTKATHGLLTGDRISLTTDGALPTGLTASTDYWVIKNDANTFWLATTYANAKAGTKINTSGSQSGTHTLRHNPFGISGASNFLLPDLRGAFLKGNGTSGVSTMVDANSAAYNAIMGSYNTDKMQGHYHATSYSDPLRSTGGSSAFAGGGSVSATTLVVQAPTTDGTNGTPRTGNVTEPGHVGVNYIIKY